MADPDDPYDELKVSVIEEESNSLPGSQQPSTCLGCGGHAVTRNRRVLGGNTCAELLPYVTFMISKRLSGIDYVHESLEEVINKSYLCKSCFTAYKKMVKLYD